MSKMSVKPKQVVYKNPDNFSNLKYYKDAKIFCDITIKVSFIILLLLTRVFICVYHVSVIQFYYMGGGGGLFRRFTMKLKSTNDSHYLDYTIL